MDSGTKDKINPWDQLEGEKPRDYQRFLDYLSLGPARTVRRLIERYESEGKKAFSVSLYAKLSMRYDWVERARAYDYTELSARLEDRTQARELARQVLVDSAAETAGILVALRDGQMDRGDTEPVLDRHGDVTGERSVVPPATRLASAKEILSLAGLTPPKRIELTGKDGEELKLRARVAVSDLSTEQIGALLATFGGDGDNNGQSDG